MTVQAEVTSFLTKRDGATTTAIARSLGANGGWTLSLLEGMESDGIVKYVDGFWHVDLIVCADCFRQVPRGTVDDEQVCARCRKA